MLIRSFFSLPLIFAALAAGAVAVDVVEAEVRDQVQEQPTLASVHTVVAEGRQAAWSPSDSSSFLATPSTTAVTSSLRASYNKLNGGLLKNQKTWKSPKEKKTKNKKTKNAENKRLKGNKELEEECYARENEVCVFFSFKNPQDSICDCTPAASSSKNHNSISSFVTCETGKTVTGTFLTAAGIVFGVFAAFTTASISAPGALALWALYGSIPDALSTPLDYITCGSDTPNQLLIEDFEKTKALVGEYYRQESYDTAVEKLNELASDIKSYTDNNVPIPVWKMDNIIILAKLVQVEASRAKAIGAKLVGEIGVLLAGYYAQYVPLVERQYCPVVIDQYKKAMEKTKERISNIRDEFTDNFNRDVNCHHTCGSGGCLCMFCGDWRVEAYCKSAEVKSAKYNFKLNGLSKGDYTCNGCYEHDQNWIKNRAQDQAKASWDADINEWWEKDVVEFYTNMTNFLEEDKIDALTNMCGQQCGPKVLVNGIPQSQSCECDGLLKYCDLEQGRCTKEINPNQTDRTYDADCPSPNLPSVNS